MSTYEYLGARIPVNGRTKKSFRDGILTENVYLDGWVNIPSGKQIVSSLSGRKETEIQVQTGPFRKDPYEGSDVPLAA